MLICTILEIFSNILWFEKNPAYTRNLAQQAMKLCVLMVDFHDCTSVMKLVLSAISICMVTIRQPLWRRVFKAKNINPELNYELSCEASKQTEWLTACGMQNLEQRCHWCSSQNLSFKELTQHSLHTKKSTEIILLKPTGTFLGKESE